MRSLSLLVLLLFAVVMCAAVTPEEMKELVANGAPQRFKSFNWLYLTDDLASDNHWTLPRQDWGRLQGWTIVQINDYEVSIKSNRGKYIGHGSSDWAKQAHVDKKWEMLTPVKNPNGSWSFKSRDNKWLSAHTKYEPQRFAVNFEKENKACEHWFLEPYTPPANALMDELLADGGRRRFRSFTETYITDDRPDLIMSEDNLVEQQQWTIIQANENEVVIESRQGLYVNHGIFDIARQESAPGVWEMLTPVKNAADGSWSFKSRDNKWLSFAMADRPYFLPQKSILEHWWLEPW